MKILRTLLDAGPINRFKGQGCTHSCPQSPDAQQAASESARQLAWSAPARRGKRMWCISDMRIIAKRFSTIQNSSESNQHGRIRGRRCYTSCRCNRRTGTAGSWIMEMIKSVTIIVLVHPLPSTSPLPSSLIPCSAISQFLPSPHVAPLHWPAV